MKQKEIQEFLARISAELTLMMEQKPDVHRFERMVTDIRVNMDRIQREGVTK